VKLLAHGALLRAARVLPPPHPFSASLVAEAPSLVAAFTDTIGRYDPFAAMAGGAGGAGPSGSPTAAEGGGAAPSAAGDVVRSGVRVLEGLARAVPALTGPAGSPTAGAGAGAASSSAAAASSSSSAAASTFSRFVASLEA
jgi:hypothetical protein